MPLRDALQRTQERFRAALEGIVDAFYFLEACRNTAGRVVDFKLIEVNQRAEAQTGMSRARLLGKGFSELFPIIGGSFERCRLAFENQQSFEAEYRIESGKGAPGWSYHQVVPLADGITITTRDVTERKRTEEEMRESQEALRAIFDSSHDALFVHEVDGKIVELNRKMLEMYGVEREEALRLGVTEDYSAAENPLHELPGRWERVVKGEDLFFEWKARRPNDGSVFDAEVSLRRMPRGERPMILATVRDISARKQAEAERERLEAQFRQAQKMEAMGQLAGGVAHDFNNFLTVILSFSGSVLEELPAQSPLKQDVLEIQAAGRRAAALTRQLLAFSRKQKVEPRDVEVNSTIRDLFKMLSSLIGEHIEIALDLADPQLFVRIDPTQLGQMIINLAVNARDAIAETGKLTIRTRVVQLGEAEARLFPGPEPAERVTIALTDSGQGMSREILARIFEPFFTTKPQGRGTGLGLSMVYGAVKQNGGTLDVSSQPGVGSTFTISLPRIPAVEQARGSDNRSLLKGTESILLVEDDEAVRRAMARSLRSQGYQVTEAENGAEAMQRYSEAEGKFDLVVIDVVMPDMSGVTLAEHLARRRSDIKLLFCSGYTDEMLSGDRFGVLKARLIFKPFEELELLRMVRELMDDLPGQRGSCRASAGLKGLEPSSAKPGSAEPSAAPAAPLP